MPGREDPDRFEGRDRMNRATPGAGIRIGTAALAAAALLAAPGELAAAGGYDRVGAVAPTTSAGSGFVPAAVDTVHALVHGRRSISVAVPSGGGTEFGLWRMSSRTLNRGLFLGVNAMAGGADSETSATRAQTLLLTFGPSFRSYRSGGGSVVPFLQTDIRAGGEYSRQSQTFPEAEEQSQSLWGVQGSAGIGTGAEWFPHHSAGISARTGIDASLVYQSRDDPDATSWSFRVRTFVSSISLHLYF
jgi:hypothetical protein